MMPPATRRLLDDPPVHGGGALPTPAQLALLGTVLCLHRPGVVNELDGWSRARRVEAHRAINGDGMQESLWFFDAGDDCCWQLHLLPDSDFLAWEQLASTVPGVCHAQASDGIGDRLWRALAQRLRGGAWQASALRFHALTPAVTKDADAGLLVASLSTLSPTGAEGAGRITRAHGIVPAAVTDDCCCRRAAAASRAASTASPAHVYTPIDLNRTGPRRSS